MTVDDLLARLRRVPFEPFALVTDAGERLPVLEPHLCRLFGDHVRVGIDPDPADGAPRSWHSLRLRRIVAAEPLFASAPRGRSKRGVWLDRPFGDLPTVPA